MSQAAMLDPLSPPWEVLKRRRIGYWQAFCFPCCRKQALETIYYKRLHRTCPSLWSSPAWRLPFAFQCCCGKGLHSQPFYLHHSFLTVCSPCTLFLSCLNPFTVFAQADSDLHRSFLNLHLHTPISPHVFLLISPYKPLKGKTCWLPIPPIQCNI